MSNQRTTRRWCVLDRSIDAVARPACAITEVGQVRATASVASSSSFLLAVHVCGSGSTLGRCLHRRSRPPSTATTRLNSTYYVAAREIGTRTDRARCTRRSGTSRGISMCSTAWAHPKQDVNIRLRISTRIHHARCATARAARGGLAGCEYRVPVPVPGTWSRVREYVAVRMQGPQYTHKRNGCRTQTRRAFY